MIEVVRLAHLIEFRGSKEKPVATLERARDLARQMHTQPAKPLSILLRTGVFYLPETLILSQEDSGTQNAKLTIAAFPGHTPVISGGQKLELDWQSGADGVMQTVTPTGLKIDQLWVNGKRKIMARFPNRIEGYGEIKAGTHFAFSKTTRVSKIV